ncbi:MAG: glycerophosphoryl diester phosphodiesterase [Sneathiella sp.]|nr:glycerophosphoryl diester phosphodiesterase [Sneathiella sp.]
MDIFPPPTTILLKQANLKLTGPFRIELKDITMIPSFFKTMPRIIGHRGARGHAPENTLASFKRAAELGTQSVEIDVSVTKDNKTVIHHDSEVDRCTDGAGPVLLKTLEEIKALDAGSWYSNDFKGETIPTMAEALGCISALNLSLNLEIKPCTGWQIPTAQIVGTELRDKNTFGLPILLSSFDIEALVAIGDMLPELPRGYLTKAIPPDWERRLYEARADSLHCQGQYVTKEIVQAVQKAGYKFLVYTVNDPDHAKQLLDWNVDAIITDYPDRLFPLL